MKPAERSPYVAIPRDLDADPGFANLSRDAQWLLQHLARDPYRLKCGAFTINDRMLAKAAKATASEVSEWWSELVSAGWLIEDDDTGEAWMTRHMEWDNTLSNPNHAKAVQRDLKRIRSPKLTRLVERVLFERWPSMNPVEGVDPGWQTPENTGDEGHPDHTSNGIEDAIGDGTSNPRNPYPEPLPGTPTPATRHPQPDPPDTAPGPGPDPRTGAQCEICLGTGIHHGPGGESAICICSNGKAVTAAERKLRAV